MRIFITDLGKYNVGELCGEWLSLPMDSEELAAKIAKYSRDGEGDVFLSDWDAPDALQINEYSNIQSLNTVAEFLDGLKDFEKPCYEYLRSEGYSHEDAAEKYQDVIYYVGMTLTNVAESLVDEGCFGDIPKFIENYIDYEAIGRDLRHDGYCETSEGVFYVG